MLRVTVTSSNLAAIEYDENKSALYVKFTSGIWYCYFGVSKKSAENFIKRPTEGSHGKHFWKYIRNNYDYQQVSKK